jgi:Ca2+-binding EF-hand superfamily protein
MLPAGALLFLMLPAAWVSAFKPSKHIGEHARTKERDHRHLSDMHKHAPIHTRWRDHEYEEECEAAWARMGPEEFDSNGEIGPDAFHDLVKEVVALHRVDSTGTVHESRAVHLDDVFNAFDVDGDGKISAEDEHNNWEALYLANMWLAQAEMIEQHEHSFHVWSDNKRRQRKRVHRKRYQIFDKHTTVDTLEQVTDANRDGYWSKRELGDALDFIHKNHDAMGRSVIQHYRHIFGILDKDRSGGLTRDEVVKTKYVDNIEHFIEQEALRSVLHEMDERKGFGLDFHRYRHLEAGENGEL